jgi:hypothetical protein
VHAQYTNVMGLLYMSKVIKRLNKENFDRMLSGHIRIGSLRYYRNIEDENRKDGSEGLIPLHVKAEGEDRIFTGSEFNKISYASGSRIRMKDDFKIRMKEGVTFRSDSDLNAYMFCTTVEDDKFESLDKKFGDHKIEIFDLREFGRIISRKLEEETFELGCLEAEGEADSITCGQAKVLYMSKESINYDTLNRPGSEPSVNIDGMFIKPSGEGYEEENEYRFVWYPFHNPSRTMCSIGLGFKYKDLYAPDIKSVIRSIT